MEKSHTGAKAGKAFDSIPEALLVKAELHSFTK